jgi:hypothetical protein
MTQSIRHKKTARGGQVGATAEGAMATGGSARQIPIG